MTNSEAKGGSPSRFNILLVDDRVENLIALEAALAELGQNIVRARSGKEALRKLLLQEFVVILLDVNMPEMDGFTTAELIRQRRRTEYTPIIFVTAATASEELRQRGYALGAVDYLFTPVEPEILRAKVSAFIDLARKSEDVRSSVELRRAAAELRAARFESRLLSLFNRLEVGIFRSGLDGQLVEANPALLRLLGISTVLEARDLPGGVASTALLTQLLSWREDGGATQEDELELPQADGSSIHVSVTKGISTDIDGVRHVEGFVTDVTKRKRAESERESLLASERQARSDAELANRLKDEFLATLSHELRTPLHAILGWAEALGHPELQEEERSLGVAAIKRNAQVQTRLIDDLLDMSRIMSGKIRLDVKKVALCALIDDVLASLQPAAAAKSLRVTRRFDPACAPIAGDSDRLQQVIWNLVSNAIKFTQERGTVHVLLEPFESGVRLSVTDDGAGIPADFLPHIFGRFRQADASSTRQHGGLGLGLAIVKHLVEMHGGRVSAHSEGLGKGARFDVLLPLSALPVVEEAEPEAAPPVEGAAAPRFSTEGVDLRGRTVLVVDDVADAREVMRLQLEEASAKVRTAASAMQALEMIRLRAPDVLVSDIGMAEYDGYFLIERVRTSPEMQRVRIPAIAVTAFARAEDRARAIEAGYDEYLVKPVESWRLVQTVARLANRPAPEQERALEA
jgi:PAS domain S-box-containing protein